MRAFRRPSIAVLVLLNLWPTLAFGQATKAAGVVSTLQGTVTASRTAVPQPIPLKFKDDVFLQDRIQTGDQSVARILLGGKALITVRERSILTVTEVPGRSTINLESGKIGLAVARERMSSGESVDIRTSNAVAAVRGTVVVAEVTRTTAQATPGPVQVVSNFYVLRDQTNQGVQITQLNTGATSNVLAGRGFSVLGGSAGRSVPIPANVNAGLQTSAGAQHSSGSAAATSSVASGQGQQAVVLANAIVGDPSGISTPASQGSLLDSSQTGSSNSPNQGNLICTTCTAVAGGAGNEEAPPPPPPFLPDITGNFPVPPADPNQPVLDVPAGHAQTIDGQLVVVHDANIVVVNEFVGIAGDVTSNEPLDRSFISMDPTTFHAASVLRIFSGGSLSLKSPLLEAVSTQFFLTSDFISVNAGAADASLTSTTHRPLVILTNSSINSAGHFTLIHGGNPLAGRGRLTLAGALLSADHTNITLTSTNNELFHAILQATVVSTGTDPFIQLSNASNLTLCTALVGCGNNELFQVETNQDSVILGGGLLSASGGTVILVTNAPVARVGGTFTTGGDIVALSGASHLTASQVLDVVNGGVVNTTGSVLSASGASVITLNGGTAISVGNNGAATIGVSGVKLVDSDLTVTAAVGNPIVVAVNNGTLNTTSTAALVDIAGHSLTIAGGALDVTGATGAAHLAGSALLLTNADLNTTALTQALVVVHGNGTLTTASPAPGVPTESLVKFARNGAGTNAVSLGGGLFLQSSGTVTLQGGMLDSTATNIAATLAPFVLHTGGTLTSAGTDLVKLTNSNFGTLAAPFINDIVRQTGGTFTSSGTLLTLDNSSVFLSGLQAVQVSGGTLNVAGAINVINGGALRGTANTTVGVTVNGATLNGTSAATPLIGATNGTIALPGGGGLVLINSATVGLAGQAVKATNSTLDFTGAVAIVGVHGNSTLTKTGATSLVDVTNGTLTLGTGSVLLTETATVTTAGPVFSANGTAISGTSAFVDINTDGTLNANGASIVSLTGINNNTLPQALSVSNDIGCGGSGGIVVSTGPVLVVSGGTLGFTGNVVRVSDAQLTAAGILSASNNSVITVAGDVLHMTNGATVTITGNAGTLDHTTLTVTGAVVSGDGNGNTVILGGSVLDATDSTVHVGRVANLVGTDAVGATPGNVSPLLVLTRSTLIVNNGDGIDLVFNAPPQNFAGRAAVLTGPGTAVTVPGAFLVTSNLNVTNVNPFIQSTGGVSFTGGGAPFIVLDDGTTLAGSLLDMGPGSLTGFDSVLQSQNTVVGNGLNSFITVNGVNPLTVVSDVIHLSAGTLTLNGALFTSTGSTITGATLLNANAGTLTSNTANSSITLTTSPTTTTGNLITFGNATFNGPLLTAHNSAISAARLLNINVGGTVNSNTASAFIVLDPSPVTTTNDAINIQGTLNLKGPLLSDTASNITAAGDVVRVRTGAVLADQSAAISAVALLTINNATVTTTAAQGDLVNVDGSPAGVATLGSLADPLKRPLLSASGTTLSFFKHLLRVVDGGAVRSTATTPFVQLVGGSFTGGTGGGTDGSLLKTFAHAGENAPSLTLSGGFLNASGGAFNSLHGAFIEIKDSATVTSAGAPFLDFSGVAPTQENQLVNIGPGVTGGTGLPPTVQVAGLLHAVDTGAPITFSTVGSALVALFDGAIVTSSGATPFIDVAGTAADRVILAPAGNVLFVGDSVVGPVTTLTLGNASLLRAVNARIAPTTASSVINITDGSNVTKAGATALLDLTTTNVVTPAAVLNVRSSQNPGPATTLNAGTGGLLTATDGTITNSTQTFATIFIAQGASVTAGAANATAAVQLTRNPLTSGNVFFHVDDTCTGICGGVNNFDLHSTVNLAGGVLRAADSPLSTGFDALFVRRSNLTAGSAASPVFQFVDTADRTYTFGVTPNVSGLLTATAAAGGSNTNAALTLNGQLFVLNNTNGTVHRTFNTTGDFAALLGGATLVSNFGGALFDSSDAIYNLGSVSNTGRLLVVRDLGGVGGIVRSSATMIGPLLNSDTDTFNTTGDFVGVLNGANFVATGAAPLITSAGSAYNVGGANLNRQFFVVSGLSGGQAATASVAGPLLASSGDTFTVSAAFLQVAAGGGTPVTFTHTNAADVSPFMQFTGSRLVLGNTTLGSGNLVEVNNNTGIRYQPVNAVFMQADTTGVQPWTADRLLFSHTATPTAAHGFNSSSTNVLFSFSGNPVSPHVFRNSLFDIQGITLAGSPDPDPDAAAAGLNLGTDQPLRHAGTLFRTSSTNVNVGDTGGAAFKLDAALYNATKPLIDLVSSTLNAGTGSIGSPQAAQVDLLNLVQNAKLSGTLVPADALVKLNASTLNIPNGVLANLSSTNALAGGSFMNLVGTSLLSLSNGSTVNIGAGIDNFNAGALVRVAGNSVFKISGGGSLISFGGGTNSVNISTAAGSNFGNCPNCTFSNINISGFSTPVLLKNNATAAQITVNPLFNGFPGRGGSNALNTAGFGSVFIVDGTNAKVVLNP